MRMAGTLAICVVVLGYATVVQGGGKNRFAHLALVRSLADGTPIVDRYHRETKDLSWYPDGHYYSTKAPGLAFLTVGPYYVLDESGFLDAAADAIGSRSTDHLALWILVLIGAVLPTGCPAVHVAQSGRRHRVGLWARHGRYRRRVHAALPVRDALLRSRARGSPGLRGVTFHALLRQRPGWLWSGFPG